MLVSEEVGLSEIDKRRFPYTALPGLSAKLLRDHFDLYEGYIRRLNELQPLLADALWKDDKWQASLMAREEGMLRNAIYLHELYFDGMTPGGRGKPADVLPSEFAKKWEKRFRLLGSATTGWMVLAYDPRTGMLIDFPMAEHGQGYVAGAVPILVMDLYEHAFATDYGIDKGAYIDTFFRNIDWEVVKNRLKKTHSTLGAFIPEARTYVKYVIEDPAGKIVRVMTWEGPADPSDVPSPPPVPPGYLVRPATPAEAAIYV